MCGYVCAMEINGVDWSQLKGSQIPRQPHYSMSRDDLSLQHDPSPPWASQWGMWPAPYHNFLMGHATTSNPAKFLTYGCLTGACWRSESEIIQSFLDGVSPQLLHHHHRFWLLFGQRTTSAPASQWKSSGQWKSLAHAFPALRCSRHYVLFHQSRAPKISGFMWFPMFHDRFSTIWGFIGEASGEG